MSYRRFNLAELETTLATLATPATVHPVLAGSVASVASVAGPQPENAAVERATVANVASVASPYGRTVAEGSRPSPGRMEQEWEAWTERLASLTPNLDPCPGFRPGQWRRLRECALTFLQTYGETAAELGWPTLGLFGVHPQLGLVRVDCCGALLIGRGSRATHLARDLIRFESGHTYRRRPGQVLSPSVPVWGSRSSDHE